MISTDADLPSPNIITASAVRVPLTAEPRCRADLVSVKDKSKSKASSLFTRVSAPLCLALNRFRPPRATRKVISDFYIRLDEPHREYSPGDLVKGSVFLETEKDLRVTHLVVNLVGRVDLYGVATYKVGKQISVNYAGPVEFEGGIILCRDQQVLCGEGRLVPSVYEFKFVMELSGKRLPSSLNFEKGSIRYTISATLTRPTTVSPTRVCEHKLNLVELIDIASYSPLKPRIISLEPGSKRGRIRSSHGFSEEKPVLKTSTDVRDTTPDATTPNSSNPHIALDTASQKGSKSNFVKGRGDVTATIEVLKAGCLRGESIPVRVSIKHTKPIKSLHGIIVTLVRQGRFDTFPISGNGLSSKGSASSLKKGLSLSSNGLTTTFRKDLSQVIVPLIVDPERLTAVVSASVRVPEDAFPTITSVPGQIVSFRYFIEVLVDLGGKLAGKEEFLNGVGMVNIPGATTGELDGVESNLGNGDPAGMMTVYGVKVIETERIKKEVKNVVSCRFELMVGTTDSASGKGRRRKTDTFVDCADISSQDKALSAVDYVKQNHPGYTDDMRTIIIPGSIDPLLDSQAQPIPIVLPPGTVDQGVPTPTPLSTPPSPSPLLPLPTPILDEMDEKTRIRIAEQALLPSAPPSFGEVGPSSLSVPMVAPETGAPSAPAYAPPAHTSLPSAPPLSLVNGEEESSESFVLQDLHFAPSAPPVELGDAAFFNSYPNQPSPHLEQPPGHGAMASEDKLEMERWRLLAAASAPPPPECSGSINGYASEGGINSSPIPSAPVLCEDADGDLPRYEH